MIARKTVVAAIRIRGEDAVSYQSVTIMFVAFYIGRSMSHRRRSFSDEEFPSRQRPPVRLRSLRAKHKPRRLLIGVEAVGTFRPSARRSDERRVGKECVSKCRSR